LIAQRGRQGGEFHTHLLFVIAAGDMERACLAAGNSSFLKHLDPQRAALQG